MAARLAWLIDMSVISEMMRRRPGPRVAGLLDSIADEASALLSSPSGRCSTGSAGPIPAGAECANRPDSDDDYQMQVRPCGP